MPSVAVDVAVVDMPEVDVPVAPAPSERSPPGMEERAAPHSEGKAAEPPAEPGRPADVEAERHGRADPYCTDPRGINVSRPKYDHPIAAGQRAEIACPVPGIHDSTF